MERIKSLNRFQKAILLLMISMVMVFTVIYPMTIAREGFLYKDVILIPTQEEDSTLYSGKIQGKQACFTVYADKKVEFQYGDTVYGPYIAQSDPAAVPKDHEMAEFMTGVELRCREEVLFRGGVLELEDYRLLYHEDGSSGNIKIVMETNGNLVDESGQIIDPVEPSVSDIFDLMAGPELTHKGEWAAWFGGVFVCIITAISILFADELFRLHLCLRVRNADDAEPSDLEIAGRYISWIVLPVMAMVLFIIGLA